MRGKRPQQKTLKRPQKAGIPRLLRACTSSSFFFRSLLPSKARTGTRAPAVVDHKKRKGKRDGGAARGSGFSATIMEAHRAREN